MHGVGRTVMVVEVRDPDRGAKPALMGLAHSAHHVSPIGGCAKASYYRSSGVDNALITSSSLTRSTRCRTYRLQLLLIGSTRKPTAR